MRIVVTLLFLLCFSCLSMAQEVLFFDDFRGADSQIQKNLNRLRRDLWVLRIAETCHAINVEGVGGVAYPLQFDSGPRGVPGVRVHCLADSLPIFPIEPGAVYTNSIVFRINDYDVFYRLNHGFEEPDVAGYLDGISLTVTLVRDESKMKAYMQLLLNQPDGITRHDLTELLLHPYTGEWLTLETTINTQAADHLLATARLTTQDGRVLGSINLIFRDPYEISLIQGQVFGVHIHPLLYLSSVERALEIKEVSVTKQ